MAKRPYHLQPSENNTLFTQILQTGVAQGIMPARAADARKWYRNKSASVRNPDIKELMSNEPQRFRQSIQIGRMYMFYYDPKMKVELKYYDKVPLVIPIEVYNNGFLGLNLHYLPPSYRAKLMDALYSLINNTRFDESTRLQLSYKLLKNAGRMKYFRPCVKRYLKAHVRSRFVSIAANEWDIALFLPTEDFQKENLRVVWEDSRQMIRRR